MPIKQQPSGRNINTSTFSCHMKSKLDYGLKPEINQQLCFSDRNLKNVQDNLKHGKLYSRQCFFQQTAEGQVN